MCCAYCKADSKCVQAELANGGNCVIAHANPKAPFGAFKPGIDVDFSDRNDHNTPYLLVV